MGQITLGKPDDKPQISNKLVSDVILGRNGNRACLLGAAEPLSHYAIDPATADPSTSAAFRESMRFTFFHWENRVLGPSMPLSHYPLHTFSLEKENLGLISVTLKPLFGDRMNGIWGTIVDVLAVFATVVGVATTLGFGAIQINGGLAYLFGLPIGFNIQFIIIIIVTILFMASAWSGLSKGIKYLSNTNMILAGLLLVLILVLGPTLLIFNMFTDSIGAYLQNIIGMSFISAPLDYQNREWIECLDDILLGMVDFMVTIRRDFYRSCFKGRTIREFLIGVLLLPTVLSFLWFAAFGTTAVNVQHSGKDTGALDWRWRDFHLHQTGTFSPGWQVTAGRLRAGPLDDAFVYNPTIGGAYHCLVDGAGGFSGYFYQGWSPGWDPHPADLDGDQVEDVFV